MNNERVEGELQQLNGEVKKIWGRLTKDKIIFHDGQEDNFYAKLKEKYGISREKGKRNMKQKSPFNISDKNNDNILNSAV